MEVGKERAFQAEGTLRAKPARLETSWREVKGRGSKARASESRTNELHRAGEKGKRQGQRQWDRRRTGSSCSAGLGSAAPWEKDCFRLSHLIAPFQPLRYPKRLSQIPFFKALSALFSCSMKSLSRGHLLCTGDSRGLKRPPGQHFPNFPVQH